MVLQWTKETILDALRQRHARRESLAWVGMPGGLLQAARKRFGGYDKAIAAAGLSYDAVRRHRAWGRHRVIEEIRRLHAAGVEMKTPAIRSECPTLLAAMRNEFGSMAGAMEAAGVPYEAPQPVSKLELFDKLKQMRERGEDLSPAAMKRREDHLYDAVRTGFGSYQNAMELLGVNWRALSGRVTWDKASLIARFRELVAGGVKPCVSDFMRHEPRMIGAATKMFGSFVKAIKAADVGYQPRRIWTRKMVVERLRELRHAQEELWVSAMRRKHADVLAAATSLFRSYRSALLRAGITWEEVEQQRRNRVGGWSKDLVLTTLRERHQKGQTLRYGYVPTPLLDVARYYFGSYAKAVEAAGFDYQEILRQGRWDKQQIIDTILELHRRGYDLSNANMRKEYRGLLTSCWRRFGSYPKAIEAAGLDYSAITRVSNHWDRETVLRKMHELAAQGEELGHSAMKKDHPALLDAAKRLFGSYGAARVAAGVGPPPLTRWSVEKIVEELKKAKGSGADMAASRLSRSHRALYDRAYTYFGAYDEALKAAGFNPQEIRRTQNWTKETVAQELAKLDVGDVDLRSSAIHRVRPDLHQAAHRHFGSYQEALEAAGIAYPPKKPLAGWAKSGVLQMLRQLHDEGEDLRFAAMKKRRSPLFFAARYYFDTYVGAITKAGLDYERIVTEQLHGKRKWKPVNHADSSAVASAQGE